MQDLTIAIIGSGPTGLTAGIYLGRSLLKPVLFSGFNMGGQLMFTRDIENFPGFPDGMRGPEFMLNMQKQAAKFGTEIRHEQVTAVDFNKQPFQIWTSLPENMDSEKLHQLSKQELFELSQKIRKNLQPSYRAQTILIATGAEHMLLGIPGEKQYLGRGVGFCAVCDGAFYRDKKVFVAGGGDTALGDALALTKFTDQVIIVHRRDQFRASKILQQQVFDNQNIKILWNTQVQEILGNERQITALKILKDGQTEEMSADGLFVAIGYKPNSSLFFDQLEMNEQSYIVTGQFGDRQALELLDKDKSGADKKYFPTMTSVSGVFAAGDVTDARYRQAVVAAGSGAMAAIDIEQWLEMLNNSK